MKTAMVALLSTAILLAVAWAGPGAAKAGEAEWWTEEGIGSSFDASTAQTEQFQAGEAVETGSLPSGGDSAIWVEPEMGSSFDYAAGRDDSGPELE